MQYGVKCTLGAPASPFITYLNTMVYLSRISIFSLNRCRDERLKKVAEQREMKARQDREKKEQIKRKYEDKAASKKLMEEKLKAENEKQKLR